MEGIKIIKVDGHWCLACDVGCPNFAAAAANRKRIKEGFGLAFWHEYEAATKRQKILPSWVPVAARLSRPALDRTYRDVV
jgi:hypothetical protein